MDVMVRRGIQEWRFVDLVHFAESFQIGITLNSTRVLTWCFATSAGRTGTKRRARPGEWIKAFSNVMMTDVLISHSVCSHQTIFRIRFIYYQIKWLICVWLYLLNGPLKLLLIRLPPRNNLIHFSCRAATSQWRVAQLSPASSNGVNRSFGSPQQQPVYSPPPRAK